MTWPQGGGPAAVVDGSCSVQVNYGGAPDAGYDFVVAAVIVTQTVHESWLGWVRNVEDTGAYPPVQLPTAPHVITEAFQTVRRAA